MPLPPSIVTDILRHCDRTRSQEARYALNRLLWEPLRRLGITLSSHCVVGRSKDILLEQEAVKLRLENDLWQCEICKKIFRSEHFLDKHLARKHSDVRRNGTEVTCLADMCGVLTPCMPLTREPLPMVSTVIVEVEDEGGERKEAEEVRRDFCENKMLRRRRVEACVGIYRDCLRGQVGWNGSVLKRIKRDLCELGVRVECVPREKVREVMGGGPDVLRPTSNRSISYSSLLAVLVAGICVMLWRVFQQGRRNHTRRENLRRKASVRRRKNLKTS